MPDLFPTTARTWIDEQFATIELGGDAAADARVRLRGHVMERYARPLSAYVRATSIARALSLDADLVALDDDAFSRLHGRGPDLTGKRDRVGQQAKAGLGPQPTSGSARDRARRRCRLT